MENQNNYNVYLDLENKIKNNDFKSKEDLNRYIVNLKQRGFISSNDNHKIEELLNLYDKFNMKTDHQLNMDGYKNVSLENQELIVSTNNDRILKTNTNHGEMEKEFKQTQNEMIASNQELVNANDVFGKIANTKKEEVTLLSMSEVFNKDNVDLEILQKIRYFITNKYINPYNYKVDIESVIFYNISTDEVLEVRKDSETNEYKILRGNEIVYENESQALEKEEENQLYEKKNIKVRRLVKENNRPFNNAAFSKISFLVLNIIIFIMSIYFIIIFK